MVFWLLLAAGFVLCQYNGLSGRTNARIALRAFVTPLLVPFLMSALCYIMFLPLIGVRAVWTYLGPVPGLGAALLLILLWVLTIKRLLIFRAHRRLARP